MPVQYEGIVAEHLAVRSRAGLFDLGHMGQLAVRGRDALQFLQFVTPNDVGSLKPGRAQYSMLLYPNGGVVDDVMTIGHTLDELAGVLKRAGAARVTNLVFARTPPH